METGNGPDSGNRMFRAGCGRNGSHPDSMTAAPPMIWVLLGRRTGDNSQMLTLAQASGLPFLARQMVFNAASALPNFLLGPSRASLTSASRAGLGPPWPAAVITSGRRSVPAALWIKKQSGGTTKLIHIGRPWAPLSWFDLIVTTSQYVLPDAPNVLTHLLPMTQPVAAEPLAPAPWLDALPRPLTGVVIGGNSRPLILDAGTAENLLHHAAGLAGREDGSLAVVTSPRTPPEVTKRLADVLAGCSAPHVLVQWRQEPPDGYRQILARADRLIVTGDSANMSAEAALSGHPVEIFPLDFRPDLRWRIVSGAGRLIGQKARHRLIGLGLLLSVREMRLYNQRLKEAGLLAGNGAAAARAEQELDAAVARLRHLLEGAPLALPYRAM